MHELFRLKEHNTTVSTEVLAGITTFFSMAYIIALSPSVLSTAGMPWGAVFIATIIAAIIGTLIMGLVANVPYGVAPGVGLNAFFTFTVVKGLGFSWQETLSMVFICGIINIIVTATKLRKMIIQAIPPVLQHAIGGGIGVFIAYVGLLNVGIVTFSPDKSSAAGANPSLTTFNTPSTILFLVGLAITIILLVCKGKGAWSFLNRGAFVIAIIAVSLLGIPMGVTSMAQSVNLGEAFSQLPETFLAIFSPKGFPALFSDPAKLPIVLVTIFAFSLSDTFDTIGTFVGTGRRSGIFSEADEKALETGKGFSSKMDKALFADATATSIGALFGTSNTTTYVESASGIAVGGRTGLTSVVIAICFALSSLFAPLISAVPSAATAPVLVVVGCMMMSSFADIKWTDLSEAIPAFFSSIFMGLSYSISYGVAAGFITYCLTMTCKGKAKEVHPIMWIVGLLFILDFVLQAIF
ncbi:NCS2 family permease [Bombiscardovia coagulans]|uniref:Guanine permease n=1 Tax=Bombiscardovia coagulans TaxID=686666 RepID=A0A261EUU4_9BIFI|nr:NCS2 family permease [Bombiscardovia coagulans]OZG50638.1 guanine permease [Bombiscardovia coagulans]